MASGPWAESAPSLSDPRSGTPSIGTGRRVSPPGAVSDLIASDQPLQVFRFTAFSESPDASTRLEERSDESLPKARYWRRSGDRMQRLPMPQGQRGMI